MDISDFLTEQPGGPFVQNGPPQGNNAREGLSQELIVARFRTFAKENFQDSVKKEIDYLQYIKRCAQLYGFKLGDDKSELFIYYDAAPFFWLCDIPAVLKMEEWLRHESKNRMSSVEGYKSIKDFFSKWAILKSEQEKKYYALSTIKLIEREVNPNNILKTVLHAVILTYDRKLYAPEKAVELLSSAHSALQQLRVNESVKKSLSYIICIFSAFAYMKRASYLEANQMLNEALSYNPAGITAKFYLALTNKRIGDSESAMLLLNDVVNYDRDSIKFAIESNNMALLAYYAQNAVTYNIFTEYDFADLLEEIEASIGAVKGLGTLNYDYLGSLIIKLHDLFLQDYYTEEVSKALDFLEHAYQALTGNQNTCIAFSKPFLKEKFDKVIELILNSIKQKYNSEISEKLIQYDLGIQDNLEAIKHLTKEIEEVKKNFKKRLDDDLAELEKNVAESISNIEFKMENIHQDKKLDPQAAFNNSMVYNVIVTLLVFIIGGFAGCYGSAIGDVNDYRDVMGVVVIAGLKWSAVTFLLGIIISMFSAAFAYMERVSEKQRMLKKITYLKSYKEKEMETVKKDNEKKLKSFLDNLSDRIDEHKKNVESLQGEKDTQQNYLQSENNKKIKEFEDKLQSVYS